jgi:hypothetical protein
MDEEKLRVAREKLTRVFRYLEALNQHRNPAKRQLREQPWSLWMRDLPDHSSVQRGTAKASSPKAKDKNGQTLEESCYVLKVRRPRLTRSPEPPEEISAWLENGWNDPSNAVAVEETLEESENGRERGIEKFADDPASTAALERWKRLRDEWVKAEQPARAAMKIFEAFYTLYGRIDREAERVELILGDRILSWRRAEWGTFHPILLQLLPCGAPLNITNSTSRSATGTTSTSSLPQKDARFRIGRILKQT